ncbi:ABC transporter ATP-binding protein [Mycoplasmatota bacterium]|nr:ABC transporter ATP-binding protein [Mycoplasmatota bacterium]
MRFLRIWKYTNKYRKLVFLSLISLIIAISIELIFPFIYKTIIDDYLIGVEKPWYVVDKTVENPVEYEGKYYAQSRNIKDNKDKWISTDNEVRVYLINNKFYFIDEYVVKGSKKISNNQLVVTDVNNIEHRYDVDLLGSNEVLNFYQPAVYPIIVLVIINVILNFIVMIITYLYRLSFFRLGNKVTYDIRKDAFEKIQKLHISYFDKIPAGKVVARVTNDTQTIINLFSRTLIVFISAIVYFVGIYISLFILNMQLAGYSLILLPILLIWGKLYRKGAKKNNQVIRSENSEINAYLNQSIKGMEVIQAFNREDLSYEEFQSHNKRYLEYRNRMLTLNATLSGNLVRSLQRLIYGAILLYFGWGALGIQTVVEVGVIYAFIDYMNKLINPINQIFGNIDVFEQSLVSCDRVFYLLDQDEIALYDDEVERFKGNIEFKHLYFAYEKDNYILKDINLKVNSGQTIALVGHTGSGKSSMMNVMLRFYDYVEGEILIDDVDIRKYSKQAYRKHVGIVLQDPVLFTGTIASNISLNNELVTDEIIEDALIKIGAERFIKKFSKGIHDPVLDMGSNFSTGERQLISFARAMIYNPAVLVLDEATANIDTETEQLIQKALEVVKKNRTTFIIAHRLSTIKDADQIIVLEKGSIVERGNHEALMSLKGKYFEMYESQLH